MNKNINQTEAVVPECEEGIDQEIANAIKRELGLTEKEVELQMRFGNHTLDPSLLGEVSELEADEVIGEISSFGLEVAFGESQYNIRPSLTNVLRLLTKLGEGATTRNRMFHNAKILGLLSDGVSISTLDGSALKAPGIATEHNPNLLHTSAFATTAAVFLLALGNKRVREAGRDIIRRVVTNKISRREFIKAGLATSGVAIVSILSLLKLDNTLINIPVQKGGESFPLIQLQSNLDKLFQGDLDYNYTEALIDFRDKIMALNTWHHLAVTTAEDTHKNIFFFAGIGHKNVTRELQKGPEALREEIKVYASYIFNEATYNLIELDKVQNGSADVLRVAKQLAYMMESFGTHHTVGTVLPTSKRKVDSKMIPPTASSVMLNTLLSEINDLEDIPYEKTRLLVLKLALAEYLRIHFIETDYFNSLNNEYSSNNSEEIKPVDFAATYRDSIVTPFTERIYSFNEGGTSSISRHPDAIAFPVGFLEINGKFVPISMSIDQLDKNSLKIKYFAKPYGGRKLVQSEDGYELSSRDPTTVFGREYTALCFLRRSRGTGDVLFNLISPDKDNFSEGTKYYLRDPNRKALSGTDVIIVSDINP